MEHRKKLLSALAGILARGVAEGHLRNDIQPEVLGNFLLGLLRVRAHDLGDAEDPRQRHELVVDFFCRGAGSSPQAIAAPAPQPAEAAQAPDAAELQKSGAESPQHE